MTDPTRRPVARRTEAHASRRRWPVVLGVAFGLLLVAVVLRRLLGDGEDFDGFWLGARTLHESGHFSSGKAVERYLPLFQVLMLPFGWLPYPAAVGLWVLLDACVLWRLPRALERLTGVAPRAQLGAWLVATPLLVDNLVLGQLGPLLLLLTVCGMADMRAGRGLRGGALVGLAGVLKLLPFALLALPLLARKGARPLAGAALVVGAVALAGALASSPAELSAAHLRWWDGMAAEHTPDVMVANNRSLRFNNQGLAITLARTLADVSPAVAEGRVQLADLPLHWIWRLSAALVAALALLGLAAVRAARPLPDARTWGTLAALVMLGQLFVSPIVWTHYFVWLLPGLVLVAHRRRLLAIGGTLFVLALAVTPARALGVHLWAAVALYVLLAVGLLRGRVAPGGAANAPVPQPAPQALP